MSRYTDVTEYLARFNIDAGRIPAYGWDETGYDYWTVDDSTKLSERMEWPSPEVYFRVNEIMRGF